MDGLRQLSIEFDTSTDVSNKASALLIIRNLDCSHYCGDIDA